jgi:competence protein ComEA
VPNPSSDSEHSHRRASSGLIVAVVVALAAVAVVALLLVRRPATAPIEIRPPAPTDTPEPTATPAPWRIYVTGAVRHPGVVQLDANARVEDALRAAGGCLRDADLERINMAAPLFDGQHLRVPAVGEELPATAVDGLPPGPSPKVNINTATAQELDTLPGVGEATAARIIEYRRQNGFFAAIEDIMNVSGIGEAKFNAIRDLITVGP